LLIKGTRTGVNLRGSQLTTDLHLDEGRANLRSTGTHDPLLLSLIKIQDEHVKQIPDLTKLAPSVNIPQKAGAQKPLAKATKNIKKVVRKKTSKKSQSESDFEQSSRRKGDKLKKRK
jgi:hypothetical protein